MKKIKPTLTLLALLALTLTGCVSKDIKEGSGFDSWDNITTAEYNGHSYIIYKGYSRGGITHNPDCPCREKGGKMTKYYFISYICCNGNVTTYGHCMMTVSNTDLASITRKNSGDKQLQKLADNTLS